MVHNVAAMGALHRGENASAEHSPHYQVNGRERVLPHAAMQRSHRDGKLASAKPRQIGYKGAARH